jgi:hypothetical protein
MASDSMAGGTPALRCPSRRSGSGIMIRAGHFPGAFSWGVFPLTTIRRGSNHRGSGGATDSVSRKGAEAKPPSRTRNGARTGNTASSPATKPVKARRETRRRPSCRRGLPLPEEEGSEEKRLALLAFVWKGFGVRLRNRSQSHFQRFQPRRNGHGRHGKER